MPDHSPYNPLDKINLGKSISNALEEQTPVALKKIEKFFGAGVYMIYYVGDFPPYKNLSRLNLNDNFSAPIYVGKAVPTGSRTGTNLDGSTPEPQLYKRLKEHTKSIEAATNLSVEDFYCRFLIVEDIWIPLGEQLAISSFSPLWNQLVDGFGNNNPGRGRYDQALSKWDVLHPGRPWAERMRGGAPYSKNQIEQEVRAYFRHL